MRVSMKLTRLSCEAMLKGASAAHPFTVRADEIAQRVDEPVDRRRDLDVDIDQVAGAPGDGEHAQGVTHGRSLDRDQVVLAEHPAWRDQGVTIRLARVEQQGAGVAARALGPGPRQLNRHRASRQLLHPDLDPLVIVHHDALDARQEADRGAVGLVAARLGDDHLVLVRQFRHGSRTVTLEIPGGLVEGRAQLCHVCDQIVRPQRDLRSALPEIVAYLGLK